MKDKATKQHEAVERNEAWAGLSPAQQLKSLQDRGHGTCKQTVKLIRILAKEGK